MVVIGDVALKTTSNTLGSGDVIESPVLVAKAILMCGPNSHPFQERTLALDQPVKIGRSVARSRAAPNNAIFDCKVLSRNHALLWFDNGKFYLQDTKSSNGTFVNNQRLSKGSEDSHEHEVCSGDTVQFGVDVVENARKVTHGCIVATLKLFLPGGKEAEANPSAPIVSAVGNVPLEDLYQLNRYLQDALQREQLLENKLTALQRLVENTRQASDVGWKALIDEDHLLSRVEVLESQLQTYSKVHEDTVRDELRQLQEEKSLYQRVAKESLKKALQEKLDAVQRLNDLERTLSNTEEECTYLDELKNRNHIEISELTHKCNEQLQILEDLSRKLLETEESKREICLSLEETKQELVGKLELQSSTERALQARIEMLSKENSHSCNHITNTLLDSIIDVAMDKTTDSTGTQVDILMERLENKCGSLENVKEELERVEYLVNKSEEDKKDHVVDDLEESKDEFKEKLTRKLEERLQDLEAHMHKLQLDNNKINHVDMSLPNQAISLKTEIDNLEQLLIGLRKKKYDTELQIADVQRKSTCAKENISKNSEQLNKLKQKLELATSLVKEKSAYIVQLEGKEQSFLGEVSDLKHKLIEAQEKLQLETKRADESTVKAEELHKQLIDTQQSSKQTMCEAAQLRDKLSQFEMDSGVRSWHDLDKLKHQCSLLHEETAQLRLEHWQLLQQTSELAFTNNLRSDCDLLPVELERTAAVRELEELRVKCQEAERIMANLEEELVLVKERYRVCNDEKIQVTQEFREVLLEYRNLTTHSHSIAVRYLIPFILAMAAVIFSIRQYF